MKTKRATPHPAQPASQAAPRSDARLPFLFGMLLGLIFLSAFIYPAGAYPLQSLLFYGITFLAAGGLSRQLLSADGSSHARLLTTLGSLPALSLFLFILWAGLRWSQAEVPALERDWNIALAALGAAFVLGCGAGVLDRTSPAPVIPDSDHLKSQISNLKSSTPPSLFTVFSRFAILGALGFGGYSLYQYFIGYPEAYQMLKAQQTGPVADIQTQSLLHALETRRVAGTLGNPNLFAAQLALFGFLCLSALRRPAERAWQWAGGLGVAAALAGLLMSQSRGGLLTMLLALAGGGLLLLDGRRGGRSAPAAPLAAMILFSLACCCARESWAAGGGLIERIGNMETIRERLYYWEIALKVWARHPLIGEGPGGFALHYLTLKAPIARESQFAHSWLFQIGAELGLIGLGLFSLVWGGLVFRVWGAWRRRRLHPDAIWCLGAVVILLFNGLFEFSLQWQSFLVALGLLAGLACGLTADPAHLTPARRLRGWAALGLGAGIAMMGLMVGTPHTLGETHRWRAELQADDGDWGAAAREYRQAVRWQPDNPALHVALARALGQLGAAEQAREHLGEAARLNPRSAAVRGAQAHWLAAHQRIEEALQKIDEAIERYPTNVAYRLDRARFNLKAGRPEAAREDLLFIERGRLPVWEYQQPGYHDLRVSAGLPTLRTDEIPK